MRLKSVPLLFMGLFALALVAPAPAVGSAGSVARWDFDVYLNDKKVGRHRFEVSESGGLKQVESEARFKYKILFIPAYRYEHSNSERWADNCLLRFEADTVANGERIRASGERDDDGFVVLGEEGRVELPECVMTFAYWNPAFLEQPRLLNPQSGEYLAVDVEPLAPEVLEVRGERVPANGYRVTAEELSLTVWYSEDDEWLGLESVTPAGHIIRYELS